MANGTVYASCSSSTITLPREAQMLEMSMPEITRSRRGAAALPPTILFMTGAAVGAAATLFLARYSNPELRQQLRSGMQRLGERARGALSRAGERAAARRTTSRPDGDQSEQLRSSVGDRASHVLSGDLPGSVGGLGAGATGELRGDTPGNDFRP
jgi:gas vesicle protein